jgi:hypothetical protein
MVSFAGVVHLKAVINESQNFIPRALRHTRVTARDLGIVRLAHAKQRSKTGIAVADPFVVKTLSYRRDQPCREYSKISEHGLDILLPWFCPRAIQFAGAGRAFCDNEVGLVRRTEKLLIIASRAIRKLGPVRKSHSNDVGVSSLSTAP